MHAIIPRRITRTNGRIKLLTSWRRWIASVLCVALFVGVLSATVAMAASTTLNFENIPAPAMIIAEYGPAVIFTRNAYLETDLRAHSGSQVLRSVQAGALGEFPPMVPLVMTFGSPQTRVKLFAGSQFGSPNGTLTAFDSDVGGTVVDTDGPRPVPGNTFTTEFEVVVPTASIRRVELQFEGTPYVSIDDLEFEGEPPPATPSMPPVVRITQPVEGANVGTSRIDIAGTVAGEGLVSPVKLTVTWMRPPEESAAPLFTSDLSLTVTGTSGQFSLPGGFNDPPLGPITITVTAGNIGGLKGTATSTVTNLPQAILDKFNDEGGAPVLGDFKFGLLDECPIAVYERGAISLCPECMDGAAIVRGDIFPKWLSLRTAFNGKGIGCPLDEEGETWAGAHVQTFQRGRIYAYPDVTISGLPGVILPRAAYVPNVFVNAIKSRGDSVSLDEKEAEKEKISSGERKVGLPLADPTDSVGPMQTWLFQRFFQVDWVPKNCGPGESDLAPPLLPTTLEIRGTPPMLWMERQGRDLIDPALEPSLFDQCVKCKDGSTPCPKSAATIWESFPCTDNLGPCSFGPEPTPPQPNPDAGTVCGNTTWPLVAEWVALRGDYFVTPFFGVITWAKMADLDNGVTHETHNGNCPYLGEGLAIGSALFPLASPIVYGTYVPVEGYGLTCGSDYEFAVRPIGRQFDPSPLPSLYGYGGADEKQGEMKTEYEEYYASAAHKFLGAPVNGDLVHMTGRWIIDCGHGSYKSELHPLFSFAWM
jgi:hypothetical protein